MASSRSPTYQRLRHYIAKQMRMSHIYQPLMLMELLGRSSPAPAQDVARRILGEDVTQIDYYTERVKRMVGKVLTSNGITAYGNGAYSLIGGDELLELCRQRLDAFREQRALEVDHIIPKNQDGSDAITNLQALCIRCNAGKRDGCLPTQEGAPTSAAQASYGHREAGCVFCALEASGRVLLENAFEALHRRRLSRERGAQPGDPASSWGRRCFMRTGI